MGDKGQVIHICYTGGPDVLMEVSPVNNAVGGNRLQEGSWAAPGLSGSSSPLSARAAAFVFSGPIKWGASPKRNGGFSPAPGAAARDASSTLANCSSFSLCVLLSSLPSLYFLQFPSVSMSLPFPSLLDDSPSYRRPCPSPQVSGRGECGCL